MIYKTQGIKYAGSKLKLIPHILDIISGLDGVRSVLDGFSGTTRVSQALAHCGFDTTANDLAHWSECFARCYLLSQKPDSYYVEILEYLNSIEGEDGWFTENYGGSEFDVKRPFRLKNTRKLDAIRNSVDSLNLSVDDRAVVLTSLIMALDSVDNTMGHYVSYLDKWSTRSSRDLLLEMPLRPQNGGRNRVFRDDIFETLQRCRNESFDLAYFDPPYGSNNEKMPSSRVRYSSYYHIWKTVILNDRPPIFGKAGRREDSRDARSASIFEEYRRDQSGEFIALQALDRLIALVNARYVLLSYSSGGRATRDQLAAIIEKNGIMVKMVKIDHRHNVMSTMRWTNQWVNSDNELCEYLFLIKKC